MSGYRPCEDCLVHEVVSEYDVGCMSCVTGECEYYHCIMCKKCKKLDLVKWIYTKTHAELVLMYGDDFVTEKLLPVHK